MFITDTGWSHETTLHPEHGFPGDMFGSALALTGNGEKAIVGASNSNAYGENAGAATLYARTGNGWDSKQTLKGNDTETYDDFGIAASMSANGATGSLGARNEESPNGEDSGAAYVFDDLSG